MEQPYLQKDKIILQYLKGIFKGNRTERFEKLFSFALTMKRSETMRISEVTLEDQELLVGASAATTRESCSSDRSDNL